MTRLLRYTIATALTAMASPTLASAASATATATATTTSTPTPSGVEVDVIFPVRNATYNLTSSLPIVFALQNLSAAAALGPFSFIWDIMPYGNVGEDSTQQPGGVINGYWTGTFTSANSTDEPYILVNQTDVQNWQFRPMFPSGSVYALQWSISWDGADKVCDNSSTELDLLGTLFFNINLGSPEPDLESLVGQCPQLGVVYEIDAAAPNSSCSAAVYSNSANTGNPCAVSLNKTVVGDISSAVESLVAASASASAASSAAWASLTAVPTPHSVAVRADVPLALGLASVFVSGLLL